MNKALTVGELKKALENVPDNLEVRLWSDSGVDQNGEVIIEEAYRHTCNLLNNVMFTDTGKSSVDYFVIYANYEEEEEEYV